jgi:serine protease AprX
MATAHAFTSATNIYRGNGLLDIGAAVSSSLNNSTQSAMFYGNGTGSLELARGSQHVSDGTADLVGEKDIFGTAWVWAQSKSWAGGVWNGKTWAGSSWAGTSWSGATWTSGDWSSKSWADSSWTSKSWASGTWTSGDWSSKSWAGKSWAGSVWADAAWR